jgi:hypothetical protein
MKTIKYIVAMLAGVAALSCVKEAGKDLPAPEADGLITIKAGLPEDVLTKAGAHVGFSWYWGEGDKIAVTGAEDTQIYKIKEGFTPKYAEFVGRPVKGDSFTISFPDNAATADWTGQTQAGNDSYAHLKYAAQLSDVDEYLSFAFKPEWAAEHNGTIKQTGVMKMVIALPDTVTAVNNVSIAAEDAIFFKGNGDAMVKKLDVAVTGGVPAADHSFTAWFTTSWNDVTVPAGTILTVSVKTKGETIEKDITFAEEAVLMGGKVNNFVIDATGWAIPTNRYASGKGTAEKPWVITTPEQMEYMYDDLVAGETRYFKLGANIDMKDITDWKPLNATGSFEKKIDFNGAGYTISNFQCISTDEAPIDYASFFGVLYGKCYDVKFVNAKIVATKNGAGIVGGYCGTAGKPGEVSHVSVQGTLEGAGTLGGMFGNVREATITACSADVIITATGQIVGGLFGLDPGLVTVTDCWTAGSVISSASIVGGICGDLKTEGSSLYNCYSTAVVKSQYFIGGIAGRANMADKKNQATKDPKNHIENCIAWNSEITSNCADASEHYSSGVIVGSTAQKNYLKNGWRKADIAFTDCPGNAAKGTAYAPFDQEDSNPDTPMVKGAGQYAFAYHGKAAGATETLSQVAQRIGWSSEVWDFSGDTPKLK